MNQDYAQDRRAARGGGLPGAAAPLGTASAAAVVLAVTLAVCAAGLATPDARAPESDELFYLGYAHNLAVHGVFGPPVAAGQTPQPGADIAPLYPLLLAAALRLDATFAAATDCVLTTAQAGAECPSGWRGPRVAQLVLNGLGLGLATVWLVPVLASPLLAGLTALFVGASGTGVYFSHHFLTESLYLPVALMFGAAFARALLGASPGWSAASGVLLGVLALVRPTFFYLALLLLPVVPVLAWVMGQRTMRAGVLLVALALAFTLTVGPWVVRNALAFDKAGITVGYGGRALSTRLAYNAMTVREYAAGWIYWLPDFGDKAAVALFGADTVSRLDLGNPAGFYTEGRNALRAEVDAATGVNLDRRARPVGDPALGWLLRHKLLAEPGTHAAVTLLLAWRGAFVAKYFGLAGLVAVALALARRGPSPARRVLLVTLTPALLLLLFNAAVSLNIPRYNLPLVLPMSIAMAMLAAGAVASLQRRFGGGWT